MAIYLPDSSTDDISLILVLCVMQAGLGLVS
jgi:hypothetical protein